MPKTKKLQKQIESKLDKLSELLDKIDEVRIINSDDPDTWDSDILYDLIENLKEILKLLEDKESETEKDNFGNPLILEEGLCTLVDEYQNEEEEEEDFKEMLKRNLDILPLLQELDQKLKTKKIGFWIDGQDCYLWENTLHYTNKIKIGDLSQTKENYYKDLVEELEKYAKERETRGKFLNSKFQEISDVELIEELKNRQKTIKMSMYAGNQHVYIKGKDIKCGIYGSFPIEVKENE